MGEFSVEISRLFPRIIDTKLLLRETVDPNVVDESLEEVFLVLQRQAYPFVEPAADGWGFTQHGDRKGFAHHAGYDSFMTAVVFLKLCCKRCRVMRRALGARDRGVPNAMDPADILQNKSWLSIVDGQLSAMDKYLSGDEIRIPEFDGEFFRSVRNKVRMSTAGVLFLSTYRPTITAPKKSSAGGRGSHDDNDDVFAVKTHKCETNDKPTTDVAAHQMWAVLKTDLSRFMSSLYDFDREFERPGALEKFHAMVDALDEDLEQTRGKIGSYLVGARGMGNSK
ncbi:Poly(A)-specific ribonuclease [Purpureocillium takamizusanense]|uniref:Poly(A)-specific ribonuclease n=1 Tax=Purpureocillium takamizusanense TaxID=2060973 RepID=A0A9Q8Q5S8_9HYPO|nr:Poly(A)-specific ribonuclease [Purpureocillium takamizusanense]UNI14289.1 Poly(A)-specific ribonuclease [Purpureocillium takamizusanense]